MCNKPTASDHCRTISAATAISFVRGPVQHAQYKLRKHERRETVCGEGFESLVEVVPNKDEGKRRLGENLN